MDWYCLEIDFLISSTRDCFGMRHKKFLSNNCARVSNEFCTSLSRAEKKTGLNFFKSEEPTEGEWLADVKPSLTTRTQILIIFFKFAHLVLQQQEIVNVCFLLQTRWASSKNHNKCVRLIILTKLMSSLNKTRQLGFKIYKCSN